MVSIRISASVRDRAWVLPAWWEGVQAQRAPDLNISVVYFDDHSSDQTAKMLRDWGVEVLNNLEWETPLSPQEAANHIWRPEALAHMTRMRNFLLDRARADGCDYLFHVDSDVLLAPGTLGRLLDGLPARTVIGPLVNVARLPRRVCWNYMFLHDNHPAAWRPPTQHGWLPFDGRYPVGVVSAAFLIPLQQGPVPQWAFHPQGEDVGFGLHARELGVKILMDTKEIARHRIIRRNAI